MLTIFRAPASIVLMMLAGNLVFSAIAIAFAVDATKLAEQGRALQPVVVAPTASASVRESAKTLANYLGRIGSTEFAIENGDGTKGIAVGLASDFPELKFA